MKYEHYVPDDYYCDGPKHLDKKDGDSTKIDTVAYELNHGYGSSLDGRSQHFCGYHCFKDWMVVYMRDFHV